MGWWKKIRDFVKSFDLFKYSVGFSYDDDQFYKTNTGGFFSLILIGILLTIFIYKFRDTFEKKNIISKLVQREDQNPSYYSTTINKAFIFAIGINGIDATHGTRYFDISMTKVTSQLLANGSKSSTNPPVPLGLCERSSWDSKGYGQIFDQLKLNQYYCPPEDVMLEFQGKYTSKIFKYYKISVSKCKSQLNPARPCATEKDIQDKLSLLKSEAFSLNYYFINSIINAQHQDYYKSYLDDNNFFFFTPNMGINANLFISQFNITTDNSLLPWADKEEKHGGIVLDQAISMSYQIATSTSTTQTTQYVKLYLKKSTTSLAYERSYQKLQDTLSYIGGIFSSIVQALFIFNLYNAMSYNIQLFRAAYYNNQNDPFPKNFNLISFFPYLLYKFLIVFGIQIPWQKLRQIHICMTEGKKHLDIRLIIRKILYAQRLGYVVLDDAQQKSLLLAQPNIKKQANEIRMDYQFYREFREKYFKDKEIDKKKIKKYTRDKFLALHRSGDGIRSADSISMPSDSVQRLDPEYNSAQNQVNQKQKYLKQIKEMLQDKDQIRFMRLDEQMKVCLKEIDYQAQSGSGDAKIKAIKILKNINPRMYKYYLGKEKIVIEQDQARSMQQN